MKKKLLLCVDTGIDDALAICYAIGQTEMDFIGICVTYGMSVLENVYRNSKKFARLMGSDVPVYMGSSKPMIRPGRDYRTAPSFIHGRDGMGNQYGEHAPEDIAGAVEGEAIDKIIELVHEYKDQLVIVTTGPMTDIAKAVEKDPSILDEVGHIYSMVGALATPGNVTPYKEANAGADPEAVKFVLEKNPPLTVIGLDVTRKTLMSFADLEKWKAIGTERSKFMTAIVEFYLEAYRQWHPYLKGCALHDPLAVGAAIHPEWIRTIPMHLTCVCEGEADGRTCEDLTKCDDENYRTEGALFVDHRAFEKHFLETCEKILTQ